MNVLQVLPGQSPSVTHPKPAFAPSAQLPVSQVPENAQSESWQHGALAACPKPGAQLPVPFRQVPPATEAAALVPQPSPRVQRFPPASLGLAPVRVTVVPVHEALTIELP